MYDLMFNIQVPNFTVTPNYTHISHLIYLTISRTNCFYILLLLLSHFQARKQKLFNFPDKVKTFSWELELFLILNSFVQFCGVCVRFQWISIFYYSSIHTAHLFRDTLCQKYATLQLIHCFSFNCWNNSGKHTIHWKSFLIGFFFDLLMFR